MQFPRLGLVLALATSSLLSASFSATADEMKARPSQNLDSIEYQGINTAIQARNEWVRDAQESRLEDAAIRAMDAMTLEGIALLREQGDYQSALDLEITLRNGAMSSSQMGILDIGDHAPLSKRLSELFTKLKKRLGPGIRQLALLSDINTLNFAIPVVFHPKGKWRSGTDYDRIEYRKHFIPFANVITYWTSKVACNHFLQLKKFFKTRICEKAALKLKKIMGRYIAPKISDGIFKLANRKSGYNSFSLDEFENSNEEFSFDAWMDMTAEEMAITLDLE